jgi:hypothetical protein
MTECRASGYALALALPLLAPAAVGCSGMNTPIYFSSATVTPLLEVSGALDAMGNAPRIENGMSLRFRNPTKAEQQSLDMQTAALGFDVPWIQRDHVHIEMVYEIVNEDTTDGTWSIGVDGANEYTKYDENIVAMTLGMGNNDAPQYIPLIPVTPQTLGAGQTFSGTVREDDFNEAELDLYGIGKWMSPFNAVLINDSQVNPIGIMNYVPPTPSFPNPPVIPALTEIDVNFSATGAKMRCDYDIRVRDDNDQLLHDTTNTLFSPAPTLFVPPAPMP